MSEFTDWVARHAEVLQGVVPEQVHHMNPEAMMAVGAHVQREYGYTGYSVRCLAGDTRGALFSVNHADGSQFRLWADGYGNVARVPDNER